MTFPIQSARTGPRRGVRRRCHWMVVLVWLGGVAAIPAQPAPGTQALAQQHVLGGRAGAEAAFPPAVAPGTAPSPLAWDSELKSLTTRPGQEFAEFTFSVTNTSDGEVTIDRVQTSCGCTVAKMPSTPWLLAPHARGELGITVNLAGKSGEFYKSTYVFSTNFAMKELRVQITIPAGGEMMRAENMKIALTNRQAVFKGDCASCHAAPAQGKMSTELYTAVCGICHDPATNPRASMVPNLRALNHPADYNYWKSMIAYGKPGTLMPAFALEQGGPLNDAQIESLARTLAKDFPSSPQLTPAAGTKAAAPPTPLKN